MPPTKKHCYACANILDARAELCPSCGIRQPLLGPGGGALVVQQPAPLTTTSKNKVTAGVFALLLGGIGVHKFYLGNVGAGVLYLLFCWTCIPSLIALVEGIQLLTMPDDVFARRYP